MCSGDGISLSERGGAVCRAIGGSSRGIPCPPIGGTGDVTRVAIYAWSYVTIQEGIIGTIDCAARPALRLATIAIVTAGLATAGCSTTTVVGGGGTHPSPTTAATPAKLFSDDFKGACSGATVSRAAKYDAAAVSHKAILFAPNGTDSYEDTTTLPSDWMVQFDANSDAYAAVDTVVCLTVESDESIQECTGYQDNGHDTDDKVDLRTATYGLSVREAKTGKELGATELTSGDDACPLVISFDNDNQTKVYDAPPAKDDLVAFVKPFVQP